LVFLTTPVCLGPLFFTFGRHSRVLVREVRTVAVVATSGPFTCALLPCGDARLIIPIGVVFPERCGRGEFCPSVEQDIQRWKSDLANAEKWVSEARTETERELAKDTVQIIRAWIDESEQLISHFKEK
jgi:hypothetical protein